MKNGFIYNNSSQSPGPKSRLRTIVHMMLQSLTNKLRSLFGQSSKRKDAYERSLDELRENEKWLRNVRGRKLDAKLGLSERDIEYLARDIDE